VKYSKDVGINWHLRMRKEIQVLKDELEITQTKLRISERKLKKI